MFGWKAAQAGDSSCCTVLLPAEVYVLSKGCSLTWSQLLQVVLTACTEICEQAAFSHCKPAALRMDSPFLVCALLELPNMSTSWPLRRSFPVLRCSVCLSFGPGSHFIGACTLWIPFSSDCSSRGTCSSQLDGLAPLIKVRLQLPRPCAICSVIGFSVPNLVF